MVMTPIVSLNILAVESCVLERSNNRTAGDTYRSSPLENALINEITRVPKYSAEFSTYTLP